MNYIVGLPAIVTTDLRIVIDKNLRAMFRIPETGSVQLLINKAYLQIFPCSASIPNAIRKDISIGRFNIPVQWAKKNGIKIGDYVFLIAANDRLLVCPSVRKANLC